MRILYTIFFFADTLLLVYLIYLFLQSFDSGGGAWALILIIAGMIASIFFLALILMNYLKLPPGRRRE